MKFLPVLGYDILKSLGMFMCPFKIKFVSISTLIFSDEESGKMSARGAHVWKVSEGELTNPPVLSSLCSLNIDTEYVLLFFMHISLKSSFLYL